MFLNSHKTTLKIIQRCVLLMGFLVLEVLGVCNFHPSYFAR